MVRPAAHGVPSLVFAFGTLEVAALFAPADLERLAASTMLADTKPLRRLDNARARTLLGDAQILVTGWGCPPIDADVLAAAPHLRLVAHAAGSVKALVSPALFARGIRLVGAADANALPVAEFTLAAILFANKRVLDLAARYRVERAGPAAYLEAMPGIGNWRRRIGIVGASRIGRRVLDLLRPFDFEVLLFDPFVSVEAAKALGAEKVELDVLLERCDLVSLHAPSLPETRHMIDRRRLRLMRDGTIFINTARGALVEQEALAAELESGRLSAILDVTEPEVLPPDSPLYTLPNVLLTPHIAGALGDERHRFGQLIAGEVERFVRGLPLHHEIEAASLWRQA